MLLSFLFGQNEVCEATQGSYFRALYSIGDTLSLEDQLRPYEICFSSINVVADTFNLASFNGNLNGGNYKIILISMNASW